MNTFTDLTGKTFERLRVLSFSHREKGCGAFWKCVCTCGTRVVIRGDYLKRGCTRSCGCILTEWLHSGKANLVHGHCKNRGESRTHQSWSSMITRCTNPNREKWKDYGGRGITVCARWQNFENFLADMGERPEGKTLDRENNNLSYSKSNCRWSTPFEQVHNRRHYHRRDLRKVA